MKREDVKTKHAEGIQFDTHLIANPANTQEWIVFFKKDAGRSFFLVNGNEESSRVLTSPHATDSSSRTSQLLPRPR